MASENSDESGQYENQDHRLQRQGGGHYEDWDKPSVIEHLRTIAQGMGSGVAQIYNDLVDESIRAEKLRKQLENVIPLLNKEDARRWQSGGGLRRPSEKSKVKTVATGKKIRVGSQEKTLYKNEKGEECVKMLMKGEHGNHYKYVSVAKLSKSAAKKK